jgi:tetratricopeptide (TPR) repeat protein
VAAAEGTDRGASPILVALLALALFFQGYVQLFFGHVENYSSLALGVALYLWLALRHLRGAAPLLAPAAALLLALACHLSAVVLVPSFAVLAVAGVREPARRTATVRDLTIAAALFAALATALARLGAGYDLLREIASVTGLVAGGTQEQAGYRFSARHLRDMVQQQLLTGPLGVWLFLPALAVARSARRAGSAAAWLLIVAAAGYLAACIVAGDSNLGYARNWDLLAPAGIVFTAAGLGLFMMVGERAGRLGPVLGVALALSLFHTLPWIAINASFERSFERLKTLPLGFGRTGTAVGRWYLVNGDAVSARAWLVKALDEYPSNNNAHFLMGMLYEGEGDLPRAAIAYGAAVQLRPDKAEYRARLAGVLDRLGRHAEAESLRALGR